MIQFSVCSYILSTGKHLRVTFDVAIHWLREVQKCGFSIVFLLLTRVNIVAFVVFAALSAWIDMRDSISSAEAIPLLRDQLRTAYLKNDVQQLQKIMEQWRMASVEAIKKRESHVWQLESKIYDLMLAVDNSARRLSRDHDDATGAPMGDITYRIYQTEIDVVVVKQFGGEVPIGYLGGRSLSNWRTDTSVMTLRELRPTFVALMAEKERGLLLDEEHELEFLSFIYDMKGNLSKLRTLRAESDEVNNRIQFLRNVIPVSVGGWGKTVSLSGGVGYVSVLTVEEDFARAMATVSIGPSGGWFLMFERRDAEWIEDASSSRGWVE